MLKQVLLLVLLTVVAMVCKAQIDAVLNATVSLHNHVIHWLSLVFSGDGIGRLLQAVLALLLIPAVIALIVSLAYWAGKRRKMPYMMHIVWISWLILLTTFTLKGV